MTAITDKQQRCSTFDVHDFMNGEDILDELRKQIVDPVDSKNDNDEYEDIPSNKEEFWTMLEQKIEEGNVSFVTKLIDTRKVKIGDTNSNGQTLLMLACDHKQYGLADAVLTSWLTNVPRNLYLACHFKADGKPMTEFCSLHPDQTLYQFRMNLEKHLRNVYMPFTRHKGSTKGRSDLVLLDAPQYKIAVRFRDSEFKKMD